VRGQQIPRRSATLSSILLSDITVSPASKRTQSRPPGWPGPEGGETFL
jgi:hypothetical protein